MALVSRAKPAVCLAAVLCAAGRMVFPANRTASRRIRGICLWVLLFFTLGFWRTCVSMAPNPLVLAMEREGTWKTDAEAEGLVSRIEQKNGQAVMELKDISIIWKGERWEEERLLLYLNEFNQNPNQNLNWSQESSLNLSQNLNQNLSQNLSQNQNLNQNPEQSDIKIGNRIRVVGTLRRYLPATNPGQFDSRAYYQAQGYYVSMYADTVEIVDPAWSMVGQALYELRIRLLDSLTRTAGEEGAVLAGMLLGDKSQIPMDVSQLYEAAGLSHLLAISGLHITLLGMGLYRSLRLAGLPYGLAGGIGTILMAGYGVMIGEPGSAVRALTMFYMALAADCLGRTYDLSNAAGTAALLMLARRPLLLTQCGFLLSFGAVFGIGLLLPLLSGRLCGSGETSGENLGRNFVVEPGETSMMEPGENISSGKRRVGHPLSFLWRHLREPLLAGITIWIVTLPVTAFFFFEVPLWGIFLNLAVLPLMSYVVLSGCLGAAAGLVNGRLGMLAVGGAVWILRFYRRLCEMAVGLPVNRLLLGKPGWGQIGGYVVLWMAVVWYLAWSGERRREESQLHPAKRPCSTRRVKWKLLRRPVLPHSSKAGWAIVALACLISISILRVRPPKELVVEFLDVGQGDCIVIQTAEGVVMVDGGSSDVKKAGEYRIAPYLKASAVDRLDLLVLTHCDSDHVNGALELMELGEVEIGGVALPRAGLNGAQAELYEKLAATIAGKGIPVWWMAAGEQWRLGNGRFVCLYPDASVWPDGANNSSLVLWYQYGEFDLLLTGDLEEAGDRILVSRECLPRADVLKVAHHGSGGASTKEFLDAVRPGWAVISCGEGNRYGHPHRELLERLGQCEAEIMVTKDLGAVRVESDGKQMTASWFLERRKGLRRDCSCR